MEKRKYVYAFAKGVADGKANQRELLGGKGANLAEMTNLGVPVPPGFTLSTEVCHHYSGVIEAKGKDSEERFLRNLHGADLFHALFTGLLLFQQFSLARNVATITFGSDIFP